MSLALRASLAGALLLGCNPGSPARTDAGRAAPVARAASSTPERPPPAPVDASVHAAPAVVDAGAAAAECALCDAASEGDLATLRRRLDVLGDSPDQAGGESRWPALVFAARGGHADALRLLLDHKAQVDARSPEGYTALVGAIEYGDLGMVKLLVERGADPNLALHNGTTPLMIASWCRFREAEAELAEIARYLLAKGARTDARNAGGRTAHQIAVERNLPRIVKVLEAAGAKD